MKKIINGRLYDTETAEMLVDYSNHFSYRNFRYLEETLYQKSTGEYFLHGFGGPMTVYAEKLENGAISGQAIIPMTEAEAREWTETHASADQYIAIFGEVEE